MFEEWCVYSDYMLTLLTDNWYLMSLVHTCSSPTTQGISSVFPFRLSKALETRTFWIITRVMQVLKDWLMLLWKWNAGSNLQKLFSLWTPLFESQDRLVFHLHRCTRERFEPENTHNRFFLMLKEKKPFSVHCAVWASRKGNGRFSRSLWPGFTRPWKPVDIERMLNSVEIDRKASTTGFSSTL